MLAIRLEKELEDRVAKVAAAKGSNKSAVVRDAVIRYLEDQEDTVLAQQARDMNAKSGGKVKSIAEVRKALGLDS
jgi:RHH-type transcriptional regulator, rel operon repressor / antitoxin RelB